MLENKSILLEGNESFEQAFDLMPENESKIRYLKTPEGNSTNVYQIFNNDSQKWSSPRQSKISDDGIIERVDTNTKRKLSNAKVFYDVFEKPTHVGTDSKNSWLIGNINNCNIMGEDYNVQGLIISSVFDPRPRYYISFERLICENQFGTLGRNNSSMYIDMNAFLNQPYSLEAKDKLQTLINAEIEKRSEEQEKIYNKLCNIKIPENKIQSMFEKLTVDRVAKNSPLRQGEEDRLAKYISAYNIDDNQNYKGTLFGFVNAYTRFNTREKTNPLDVMNKPIITSKILDTPCDFDFLCKEAVINAGAA